MKRSIRRALLPSRVVLALSAVLVAAAAAPEAHAQTLPMGVVEPRIECVTGDRQAYVAHFGYRSVWHEVLTLPVMAEDNILFGGSISPFVGQPIVFVPGLHHDVFAATFDATESSHYFWHLNGTTLRFGLDSPHCAYPEMPRVAVFASCATSVQGSRSATVRFGYLNAAPFPMSYPVPHTFNRMGEASVAAESSDRGQPTTLVPGLVANAFTVEFNPERESEVHWTVEGDTAFATPGLPNVPLCGPGVRMTLSGSGQSALPGNVFSAPLQVRLVDASGAPMAGRTVTFRADDAAVTFWPHARVTDADGVIRATATAGATPRAVRVYADARGARVSATFYLDIEAAKALRGR
jgi:hypothetical protein